MEIDDSGGTLTGQSLLQGIRSRSMKGLAFPGATRGNRSSVDLPTRFGYRERRWRVIGAVLDPIHATRRHLPSHRKNTRDLLFRVENATPSHRPMEGMPATSTATHSPNPVPFVPTRRNSAHLSCQTDGTAELTAPHGLAAFIGRADHRISGAASTVAPYPRKTLRVTKVGSGP